MILVGRFHLRPSHDSVGMVQCRAECWGCDSSVSLVAVTAVFVRGHGAPRALPRALWSLWFPTCPEGPRSSCTHTLRLPSPHSAALVT